MVLVRSLCRWNVRLSNLIGYSNRHSVRNKSAWIMNASEDEEENSSTSSESDEIDVESLFLDSRVRQLLKSLIGMDLEKCYAERTVRNTERSHFALMNDEMLANFRKSLEERALRFMQLVPIKEPRIDGYTVLAVDPKLKDLDTAKFVFTDISHYTTNQDRTVVVRDPDGTLRTSTPEEHDRMNRIYYPEPDRTVRPMPLFSDPYFTNALNRSKHELVLDWACNFYDPDDPDFVKLCRRVFDNVLETNNFEALRSTRHFALLVFYLVINGKIIPLLNYFVNIKSISDVANVIRLCKLSIPNWPSEFNEEDNDQTVIEDFLQQNKQIAKEMPELINLLRNVKK
ncbi:mitochondrial 28S ribosomal protein s22 domain-containing protein [Ditylenchus destructor]|nr:mitochondrial 28S ribosomal protein s22 domain-containing protein [Ditylenchus destructor]